MQYTSLGDAADLSHLDSHARAATPPQEQMRSKKSWAQALLAFSFPYNLKRLCSVSGEGDESLSVLNGVRVLSILYVIIGHAYSFALSFSI